MDQSDGRDVLDSVLKYVRSKDRKPIFKPHDLATVIIERCTGVLASANNRLTPGYNIVDVFGSAIGKVVCVHGCGSIVHFPYHEPRTQGISSTPSLASV